MGLFSFSVFWSLFQWSASKLLLSEELIIYFRQYSWSHLLNISVNKNCACFVCSLIWCGLWLPRAEKKNLYRPGQLMPSKMIPALESWQNVGSGQAKQDKTCVVVCWTEAWFGWLAMPCCHTSGSKVSPWVRQTQLQHLNWLHTFAQCAHWAVLGETVTGGTPSFNSGGKFFLGLGKRASSSLLLLQIMECWLILMVQNFLFILTGNTINIILWYNVEQTWMCKPCQFQNGIVSVQYKFRTFPKKFP